MTRFILAILVYFVVSEIHARDSFSNLAIERLVHMRKMIVSVRQSNWDSDQNEAEFWTKNAQNALNNKLMERKYEGRAKNIILFLGDGMSIPTITASRIYQGQKKGMSGEENQISFEKFPYVGLSKTYCVNQQVTDSAASATAYLTGVKANFGTIGVTAAVEMNNCNSSLNRRTHTSSIADWAQKAGMRTGFVTTARVTHASPAPLYAHSASRDWESDSDIINDSEDPLVCEDISSQLIHNKVGRKMNVIFGGGREKLLPNNIRDESGVLGSRLDERNLIEEWKEYKQKLNSSYAYVYDRDGLNNVTNQDYVLGLFSSSHMSYELDRDRKVQPSIAEMTEKAIKLLSKDKNRGFFLFVEGARIDMAHHDQLAVKSLEETVAFSEAIDVAVSLTNINETLIVVTSDHAHTMSISGYPTRGNNIVDIADTADDGLPYLTLGYANGNINGLESDGERHNVSEDQNLGTKDYEYPGMINLNSESHGGDDVGIFARGPWAHLFTGVNEQNVIPHLMAYAACIGNGKTLCNQERFRWN